MEKKINMETLENNLVKMIEKKEKEENNENCSTFENLTSY
jgi:hypothetical protein